MTCPTADRLRSTWYAVSVQLTDQSTEADKIAAMKQRETPEYQAAIHELIDHMALCDECKKVWNPPKPVDEDEPLWRQRLARQA